MGAGLYIAWLWIDKNSKPDWNSARKRLSWHESKPCRWWSEELLEYVFDLPHPNDFDRAEMLQEMRQAFALVQEIWHHEPHDCIRWPMGPLEVLVTGGMSWGDPPTDKIKPLRIFEETKMAEAAGFYTFPGR